MIPTGFYQYTVMPFRLKNVPAINIVIFSDTWDQRMKQFLTHLRQAQLTVTSLAKHVLHVVGKGGVKPIHAKVEAITNFPTPKNKSQL